MPRTMTLEISSDAQELLILRFHAFVAEMESLAEQAPDGRVLEVLETAAVDGGRQLTLAALESTVQKRIDDLEKKGRRFGSATAVENAKIAEQPRDR